jgi:hypothetical protein
MNCPWKMKRGFLPARARRLQAYVTDAADDDMAVTLTWFLSTPAMYLAPQGHALSQQKAYGFGGTSCVHGWLMCQHLEDARGTNAPAEILGAR